MNNNSVDYSQKVVEMKNITKKFGNFVANDNINLTVHKGEVHALLGENGAGKSTLMNILYGLYNPTSGEIYINGELTDISNPNVAIEKGIGMVHQHFMLVQPFTVAENIVLGTEPTKNAGAIDMKKAIEETSRRRKLQEEYNKENNIIPKTIIKEIGEVISNEDEKELEKIEKEQKTDIINIESIEKIEEEMKKAAKNLDFERAMELRDILLELKMK